MASKIKYLMLIDHNNQGQIRSELIDYYQEGPVIKFVDVAIPSDRFGDAQVFFDLYGQLLSGEKTKVEMATDAWIGLEMDIEEARILAFRPDARPKQVQRLGGTTLFEFAKQVLALRNDLDSSVRKGVSWQGIPIGKKLTEPMYYDPQTNKIGYWKDIEQD